MKQDFKKFSKEKLIKTRSDLKYQLIVQKGKLREIGFNPRSNTGIKPQMVRNIRRNIARINTELNIR